MQSLTMNSKMHWPGLILALVACLAVGALAGVATTIEIPTWYAQLNKPAWTPPNWLFGPVWTTLYVMMAVAVWLVWRRIGWGAGVWLFVAQLALNFLWSFIFFRFHQIGLALADIIALWLAIIATIWSFSRISPAAAWLLSPYLVWVTFATCLNFAIWRLNG